MVPKVPLKPQHLKDIFSYLGKQIQINTLCYCTHLNLDDGVIERQNKANRTESEMSIIPTDLLCFGEK